MDLDLVLLRGRKLLASFSDPRFMRALRLGVGPAIDHRAALSSLHPGLVVDVGANRGQFALFARHLWPAARIISFEPLPQAGAVCRAVMNGDSNFTLVEAAVAARSGVSLINMTDADDSSSLLPLGEQHRALYGSAVARQVEVRIGRLSEFLDPPTIQQPALIKIDTQGFELEVLKGSTELLPLVSHIYAELSFVELYTGQPLASEVIAHLHDHEFELVGVYNLMKDRAGKPIQADMLFAQRTPDRADTLPPNLSAGN